MVPKKYPYFSSRARTLQQQFSESNEPFLDRSDIFSDATDLKNTLVLLFFLGPCSKGAVQGRSVFLNICPRIPEDLF